MVLRCISTILVILFMFLPIETRGYEITRVIAVDSGGTEPMLGPLKWSPDGTKLAYFKHGRLMASDTLGNTRQLTDMRFAPRRFEWQSDSVLVVCDQRYYEELARVTKILLVNTNTGSVTFIDSCVGGITPKKSPRQIDGPFLSLEKEVYYFVEDKGRRDLRFLTDSPREPIQSTAGYAEKHVLRWGTDGMYEVKGDQSDSIFIARRSSAAAQLGGVLSKDRQYFLQGGILFRRSDSVFIVLDTMIGPIPAGTKGCGITYETFNPRLPEIVFNLTCDDGHTYGVDRIATYNYVTNTLTVLDTILGLHDCTTPVYAADGTRIAFYSRGLVYVIYREGA